MYSFSRSIRGKYVKEKQDMTSNEKPRPRFCVNCGHEFPVGIKIRFCPHCRYFIPMQFRPFQEQFEAEIKFCIYCGEFLNEHDFITGKCGACLKDLPFLA